MFGWFDWVTPLTAPLTDPFVHYLFMQRALLGCILLSLSAGPLGVFLVLRRMILMGDALSHGVLPGMAGGFLLWGSSLWALSLGGILAGLGIGVASTFATKNSWLTEDGAFAGFYICSLALGVLLLSLCGQQIDLVHILFGSILAISQDSLIFMGFSSLLTVVFCCVWYRPLILECFDPVFFQVAGGRKLLVQGMFLGVLTLNLVAAFQALGTLMALGLLILPAITLRLLSQRLWVLCVGASLVGFIGSVCGLWLSYHWGCASGPAIVLVLGGFYSLALMGKGGLPWARLWIRKIGGYCALAILFSTIEGGAVSRDSVSSAPLKIIVTFSILKDLVQQVAGDQVQVTALVGPGEDSHQYQPTPKDGVRVSKADLIFINGLGFEGWIQRLLKGSGYNGPIVAVSEGLPDLIRRAEYTDPHVWQDVQMVRKCVQVIAEALCRCDPARKAYFSARAQAYDATLCALDHWIKKRVSEVPLTAEAVVLNHGAFAYFSRAYSVKIHVCVPGTLEAFSAKDLAHLIQRARAGTVSSIFTVMGSRVDLAEIVAKEVELPFGGVLYSDSLSKLGGGAETYEALMRYNTQILLQGLTRGFVSKGG